LLNELISGSVTDAEQIALRERCSVLTSNMTISLAFLAPRLVRAAVEGMDSAARSAWVESAAIAHVPKAAPSPPKCSSVQKKGRPQRIVRQEPQFWMRRQSVQNSRWTWRTSTAVGVSSRKKGRIRRMTQVGRIESSRDTAGGLIDAQGVRLRRCSRSSRRYCPNRSRCDAGSPGSDSIRNSRSAG
jgi:hypothetical protein